MGFPHCCGLYKETPVFATQPALSTHARKPNLLPLVQRLIEARERGTDRSGGCLHRGEPGAEGRHASDRSERGFGGTRVRERVGGFKRGGDKLVETSALRLPSRAPVSSPRDRPAPPRWQPFNSPRVNGYQVHALARQPVATQSAEAAWRAQSNATQSSAPARHRNFW